MKTLNELMLEAEAEVKTPAGLFKVCLHAALYRDHIAFLEEQRREREPEPYADSVADGKRARGELSKVCTCEEGE